MNQKKEFGFSEKIRLSQKEMDTYQKITVLGAGAFGTAMANLLVSAGKNVTLWVREENLLKDIQTKNENTLYLPGLKLEEFTVTSEFSEAVSDSDLLVFAVPCQYLRSFLVSHKTSIAKETVLVSLAKGIEISTTLLPHQIFKDVFGEDVLKRFASISGPTFAKEIYNQTPTAASVASSDIEIARKIQKSLSTKSFRLYATDDVMGVELGGAIKNIMAIGVGICDGLEFGQNSRAGFVTRCLHEIIRLGEKLGAKRETFSGLSGIGDLMLTCFGDLSRNRQVGLRLGKGESLKDILDSMNHVAEGVSTAKAVYEFNQSLKLDLPNIEHIYKALYEDLDPREAFKILMSRELKDEF